MERTIQDFGKKFQESVLRKSTSEFGVTLHESSVFLSTISQNACSGFLEELKLGKIQGLTGVKAQGDSSQICIDYCSMCNHLFSKNAQFKYNIISCIKISQSSNLYKIQLQFKKPTDGQF